MHVEDIRLLGDLDGASPNLLAATLESTACLGLKGRS